LSIYLYNCFKQLFDKLPILKYKESTSEKRRVEEMITHTKDGFQAEGEAVLITGCSSGIGRATAVELARHGFTVFATLRKQADANSLQNLLEPNLIPIQPLDLTNLEQIPAVAETVANELERRGQPGLYALINNAGAGAISPIELMDLELFRIEVDARLVGAVAMIQAFLPMIRRQPGSRILWITTPANIPTSYVTNIHACDFAVNCIARTLDLELKQWHIPTIMIRCGGIKTSAGLNTTSEVKALLQKEPRQRVEPYIPALQKWSREMSKFDEKRTEADKVANLIRKVLGTKAPRRRYSIGYLAGAAAFLESLPQVLADGILKSRV
jgi:NAD(P)-dependent dehydrogenase (short-subunit alcohol dehydrogenase family)